VQVNEPNRATRVHEFNPSRPDDDREIALLHTATVQSPAPPRRPVDDPTPGPADPGPLDDPPPTRPNDPIEEPPPNEDEPGPIEEPPPGHEDTPDIDDPMPRPEPPPLHVMPAGAPA
jgi:hypothetical protein